MEISFKAFFEQFFLERELVKKYSYSELIHIAKLFLEKIKVGKYEEFNMLNKILINNKQQNKLKHYLHWLKKDKPFQYILKETYFYNCIIKLNSVVLIPRPETEDLIEYISQDYRNNNNPLNVVDLGTGSGCIAIALKKKFPNWQIMALDYQQKIIDLAKKNAILNHCLIDFKKINLLKCKTNPINKNINIIVSNPPYIPKNKYELLDHRITKYEPLNALFVSDKNPLIFYKKILTWVENVQNQALKIFLETEEDFIFEVENLFKPKYKTSIFKDRYNKERFIKIDIKTNSKY